MSWRYDVSWNKGFHWSNVYYHRQKSTGIKVLLKMFFSAQMRCASIHKNLVFYTFVCDFLGEMRGWCETVFILCTLIVVTPCGKLPNRQHCIFSPALV